MLRLVPRLALPATASLCMLGLLPAAPAVAQQQEVRAIPPVSFNVLVAFASKEKGPVDPGCAKLKARLPMDYGSLRTFRQETLEVVFGDRGSVPLPPGDIMLMPVQVHKGLLHAQFEMQGRVNMRMQMTNGKAVIFGPMRYEDGYLIVQIVPDFSMYIEDDLPGHRGPELYKVSDQKVAPSGR